MNKVSAIITAIVGVFCIICGFILFTDPAYLKDGILILILGIAFLVYAVLRLKKLAAMPKKERVKKNPYPEKVGFIDKKPDADKND